MNKLKTIFLLSGFFLVKTTWSQNSLDTNKMIAEIVRGENDTSVFLYDSKVDTFFLNKIKSAISKNQLCGLEFTPQTSKKDSIKITQQECNYILSEFEKHKVTYWKENLFRNSKLVSLDTLLKLKDSLNGIYFQKSNHKQSLLKVTQFTKPVFFHNNQLFIMQIVNWWFSKSYQLSSINYDLIVYKHEKEKWIKWLIVDGDTLDF